MGVADEEAINSNDSMMVESISESARESKGKELKRKTTCREGGEIEGPRRHVHIQRNHCDITYGP